MWEDKIEQEIEYFSAENLPLSVGIIFDISGSMGNKLTPARDRRKHISGMGDRDDEYFLIVFSDSPQLTETSRRISPKLQNRLLAHQAKGARRFTTPCTSAWSKSAAEAIPAKPCCSSPTVRTTTAAIRSQTWREFAREHDVQIYAIGIVDELTRKTRDTGPSRTRGSCKFDGRTCVLSFFCLRTESICARIGLDLKNQYVLGYSFRSIAPMTASGEKIRVKVDTPKGMPPLSVRAKTRYYAPTTATVAK